MSAVRAMEAGGSGGVGTVVAVRVDARVGSVGSARAVRTSGALRLRMCGGGLVAVESVLDFVDETRHDGWLLG